MSLHFQSICSSSSGNCIYLRSDKTSILIDCGLSSMKRTRAVLSQINGKAGDIDRVLVSHSHSDHISYYPLRVLNDHGIAVHTSGDCVKQIRDKHFRDDKLKNLEIEVFGNKKFVIGDLCIRPFEVQHNPDYPTSGFQIFHEDKKVVVVTDFCRWDDVFENFLDADFIFVESNHDLKLLRQFFNPNSRYHMPNPDTAELLVNVIKESDNVPRMVMLGHISSQRNDAKIAVNEIINLFREENMKMDFELSSAPLKEAGAAVRIG